MMNSPTRSFEKMIENEFSKLTLDKIESGGANFDFWDLMYIFASGMKYEQDNKKQWHPITEPPEYDNYIIITYESGISEIFYFWGNTWENLIETISKSCSINSGLPEKWCYLPEDD